MFSVLFFYMINEQSASGFRCNGRVVIDETTSGWHGKHEKRSDGLPAADTHKGKARGGLVYDQERM